MKTLVQCDFDGTITEEDISFLLLDAFAQGDWRRLLQKYKEGRISVGEFNTRAFAMVKADKDRLLEALEGKVKVRAGFHELVNYCLRQGFRLVIVSNGVDFYIESVLKDLGLKDLEVHAAQASFHPEGMKVQYVGPDGKRLEDGFKEAYIQSFLKLGYRVIYIGNGDSDLAPAKCAHHVFAIGDLLAYSKENNLHFGPFDDFRDVVKDLEQMSQFPL
ncbi:MAG TPA: MtnX-like HAD-IB family phosphatase [Dehalococcoidia bacterium]|nr:MtnX-like HAD-IB family phosphatase [Dehalococcoidia bacterium]